MTEGNSKLPPWLHGPMELIRHAEGHLRNAGDTDRRIALIGFDNAVEVCIDVYLRLHPRLRAGVELSRETVEKARKNYHTKLEFLDDQMRGRGLADRIAVDELLWYHTLRNELYHSGNGMVPELHVVEGARAAALEVFLVLFSFDAADKLDSAAATPPAQPHQTPFPAVRQSDEMEFLRIFIEFEKELLRLAAQVAPSDDSRKHGTGPLWKAVSAARPELRQWDIQMREIIAVRNNLVHGKGDGLSTDKVEELAINAMEIMEVVEKIIRDNHSDRGA